MKNLSWFIVIGILLAACGPTPAVPDLTQVLPSAQIDLPLPDSEKTRVALFLTSVPETATVEPSPTLQPSATATIEPPTPTPSITLLPSETVIPTASLTATVETPTASPTLLVTATPAVSATPEVGAGDESSQEELPFFITAIEFLIWPGSACIFGFLLLALSLSMVVFLIQKRLQVGYPRSLGSLKPRWKYVQVNGVISRFSDRLDKKEAFTSGTKGSQPVAAMRLLIEELNASTGKWRAIKDVSRCAQLILDDGTDTIRIDSEKETLQMDGVGFVPSMEQVRVALKLLDLPLKLAETDNLRYKLWILHIGEPVIALGAVQDSPIVLIKDQQQPLVIIPDEEVRHKIRANRRSMRTLWVLAAILGLSGFCLSEIGIALTLIRLMP